MALGDLTQNGSHLLRDVAVRRIEQFITSDVRRESDRSRG
jgi:hypothetical protein